MTREIKIGCSIGAMAGITPLLVSLISVDVELLADIFVPAIVIGYLIKAIGLMVLGAFVVFVNSESDYKKAFQLGLMAPALVVGTINANNFSEAKKEIIDLESELGNRASVTITPEGETTSFFQRINFSLISSAYADSSNTLIGKHDNPTTANLLWYGMSGKVDNAWFVIVDSHADKLQARRRAEQMKGRGYNARVVPDKRRKGNYVVTIGSYLSLKEARILHKKAIHDGLSKHPYLWKWK
jgi:hypothetical protein